MATLYATLADGHKIYGPDPSEESAAYLREEAARRAEKHNMVWLTWAGEKTYHFLVAGNSLCKDEWVGSFPYASKVIPKILRCKECQRLNEKRKRDEKRIEKLAAD